MNFKTDVLAHLGDYKRDKLSIEENGKWWLNKKENSYVTHGHILPVTDDDTSNQKYHMNNIRKQNILPTYRNRCWSYINKEKIKFHQFFHHLNSSQAMCLNFFYPFTENCSLRSSIVSVIQSKCLEKIAVKNPNLFSIIFEYKSPLDAYQSQIPTNFDLCISDESTKLFFEVKYTEEGFGGIDKHKMARYKEKYQKLYYDLAAHVILDKWNTFENFIKHYQIMRNLVHVNEKSFVIFLYPERDCSDSDSRLRRFIITVIE